MNFILREKTASNGGWFKTVFPLFVFIASMMILYEGMFSSYSILLTPYKWSPTKNAIWYALTRVGWAVATMSLYFLMICGHNPTALYTGTSGNVCIISAMVWPNYMLSPLIYMNMYSRVKEAIYMTLFANCVLGMG